MSRPIDGDGTIRYSTGRPGRENAPAVADPPTRPTTPGSSTAVMAATVSRRAQGPRILSMSLILQIHPSSGYEQHVFSHDPMIAIRQCSVLDTALPRPLD